METFIKVKNPTEYTEIFTSPTLYLSVKETEEIENNKIYSITKITETEVFSGETSQFEKSSEETETLLTTEDKNEFINAINNLREEFSNNFNSLSEVDIIGDKIICTKSTVEDKIIETFVFSEQIKQNENETEIK